MRAAIATLFVLVGLALVPLAAQQAKSQWKTPWGDPDLQGTWSNQTLTPLERPRQFADKPVLTEAEAAAYEKQLVDAGNVDNRNPGTVQDVNLAYNQVWWDRGNKIVADRRTALIVDPPDGRIPALTSAAQKRRDEDRSASDNEKSAASWLDFDVYSRCIIRSALPRLSTGYNNNYEIVQAPGVVAIVQEQMHETRMIPLGNAPHLPSDVRQWLGDSRGHWDGNTLVVETTNFTDEGRGSTFQYATKNMKLVERFTRTSDRTIDYQFTVSDPETWTRPWTAKLPWNRIDGLIYEYACHEGNVGLEHMLSAARAADRKK
ncbi:MAG TPA: hypothetical protein VN654_02010 [Vicinamibacterales bacterium]|jgi:hypothetical protein|nr:hypothetical protein [Vicinamibacterales bacterium]